jgi:1-acyl-sn-glycerol-3-phosphate acyltransferase
VQSSPSVESSSVALTREAAAPRWRILLNRLLFRGMLFSMGLVAVALYRVRRDKTVAWRFAKARARTLIWLCGVRVRVRGVERLGSGPYMFVSNHQSHFDIALLLGYLPGNNRFAAKKELFGEPILGLVLRTLGMIPLDRDDPARAIDTLNRLRLDGYSTVVFPEGTRSRDGTLLPFKKGPFVAAIRLGVPVVPVVCKGTAAVMPKGGYLSILPGEVELAVQAPIPTAGLTYADRDVLLEEARRRIAAGLAQESSRP